MRAPSMLKMKICAAALMLVACRARVSAGATTTSAMGDWNAWSDLTPLWEAARHHAADPAVAALRDARELLRKGKPRSADARLSESAGGAGHAWVAVARADLAALYFTLCVRGVAWRLADDQRPDATDRKADFSEQTRVEPGDISVEATLTNLDAALASDDKALVTQARIARARVSAFAHQCAANQEVAELAQRTFEADLATLAAEGHLTPDLAYMWAGVQMTRFSGAAARPFLLQAQDGGFDHPAITFMLAVIALEDGDLDQAQRLAVDATARYKAAGDRQHEAESLYVQGDVAKARKQPAAARDHYRGALALNPTHGPSMLALAELRVADDGVDGAAEEIHQSLANLLFQKPLDADTVRQAAQNLESLVVLATAPHQVQFVRDGLLHGIDRDPDPARRGLRYFFAATLDVRLREYELAYGHGVLAKEEFGETEVAAPMDLEAFLQHVRPQQ